MKVSIITVSYNSAKTIIETIESVVNQSYDNIEYIIIDGDSKDGTKDIIESYKHQIHTIVSEPDKGIYDAMNKGLALATGDVIGLLNSDDTFAHKDVIKNVVATFNAKQVDAVYGNLKYINGATKATVRNWKSGAYRRSKFLFGWMPPHPTFFVKREAYEQFGRFDTSLKSAADYELMLRFLYKNKVTAAHNNEVMVLMRTGGQSNASLKNHILANLEDRKAWIKNQLYPYFFTTLLKPVRKIPQFVNL